MSPRNQDGTNCKGNLFPGESDDSLNLDFTPNLLHKKHKVIKLVKAQLLNLQEHGILDSIKSNAADSEYGGNKNVNFTLDVSNDDDAGEGLARLTAEDGFREMEYRSNELRSPLLWLVGLFLLLTVMFIMVLLAAWLSVGPLSNRAPHTPIPWSSLVKTDGICDLERKYLLRWSTFNKLE